jgi:hypothetical protein
MFVPCGRAIDSILLLCNARKIGWLTSPNYLNNSVIHENPPIDDDFFCLAIAGLF